MIHKSGSLSSYAVLEDILGVLGVLEVSELLQMQLARNKKSGPVRLTPYKEREKGPMVARRPTLGLSTSL